MKPFYARRTRTPAEAAADIFSVFTDPSLESGAAYFRDRTGYFPVADHVADRNRQDDLLAVSEALLAKAWGA
jgi:hypothetical protein